LNRDDPVERVVATAATLAAVAMAVACAQFAISRTTQFARARRLARELGVVDDFVVLRDSEPIAYAMPGGPVTVSVGMLQSLTPPEQCAVLAHERAHVSHRHHRWRLLVDGCARINPLLRPVAQAVYGLTERWADEIAAERIGNRREVASALTRASEVTRNWRVNGTRLDFGSLTVADRIAALDAEPPCRSWWRAAGLCLIVAAIGFATFRAYNSLDLVYDAAQRAAAIHR
jgi:beta-lactamase regulating signal transducer with metallopeptidase domain